MGAEPVHDPDRLVKFIDEYLVRNPYMRLPFIVSDQDERFNAVPPELEKIREEMLAEETQRGYDKQPRDQQASGPGEPPAVPTLPASPTEESRGTKALKRVLKRKGKR